MNHRVDWVTTYPFGWVYRDELPEAPVDGHPTTNGDVRIGNDVWIARGCTIMSGITIGDGAVIGANATVVKDVPPYYIAAGNPAKAIRPRFPDKIIERLLVLRWWDLPVEDIRTIHRALCSVPEPVVLDGLIKCYRGDAD